MIRFMNIFCNSYCPEGNAKSMAEEIDWDRRERHRRRLPVVSLNFSRLMRAVTRLSFVFQTCIIIQPRTNISSISTINKV